MWPTQDVSATSCGRHKMCRPSCGRHPQMSRDSPRHRRAMIPIFTAPFLDRQYSHRRARCRHSLCDRQYSHLHRRAATSLREMLIFTAPSPRSAKFSAPSPCNQAISFSQNFDSLLIDLCKLFISAKMTLDQPIQNVGRFRNQTRMKETSKNCLVEELKKMNQKHLPQADLHEEQWYPKWKFQYQRIVYQVNERKIPWKLR